MSLFYRLSGGKIVFFGPGTFHKKETLKSHGARFNGADKSWVAEATETLLQLAVDLGAVGPVGSSSVTPAPAGQTPTVTNTLTVPTKTQVEHDSAQGLTVTQLVNEAQRALSSAFPNPIWVVGELQNLSKRGEHYFFDIAEGKDAGHATATVTVKATLWGTNFRYLERRHTAAKLAELFVDGTQIRVLVRVGLYKDRGQISLTIEDVDPLFTQGALALARAELLRKLRHAGLDRKNKELVLPAFPLRVALITAAQSRAHTDFEHQLLSSGQYPGDLILIPCPMQGDRVPKAVVKSLEVAATAQVDLIVVSRGGGSAADLRWFDGEEIAVAIANCPVPVIAAIGHHDDHCVAEAVCHTRQKTPTAAAEFILDILRATRRQLNEHAHWLASALDREFTRFGKILGSFELRLADACHQLFQRFRERLNLQAASLGRSFDHWNERQRLVFMNLSVQVFEMGRRRFDRASDELRGFASKLERAASDLLTRCREQMSRLEQELIRRDPTPWLETGWTQLSEDGKPILSVNGIKLGAALQARLCDGKLSLRVESVEKRKVAQNNLAQSKDK